MTNLKNLLREFDRISDKEAKTPFTKLKDKDIDNDGDIDAADSYLHKKLGAVALNSEQEIKEAYLPDNIKKFAKRKGVSALVNKIAGWVEKSGKRITGGTAIGKDYSTLILDLTHQGSEIRINTDDDTVEVYDEPVRNFNDFKRIMSDNDINEMSTTASAPGYETPYAFGAADDETMEQGGYKKVKTKKDESAYKQMMNQLHEMRYSDYKNDASASPKTKVNKGISEVNRMLAEIEKIVHRNIKLKNEMGINSNDYWKNTSKNFAKISERLVRINNKLKELSQ